MNKETKNKNIFLLISFLIGFTSLVYEVYGFKVLFFYFIESSHAVSVALSSFLSGLAFSSLIFSKYVKEKVHKCMIMLIFMQVFIIIYAFFVLKNFDFIPYIIDWVSLHLEHETLIFSAKLIIIWIFLFIPAFFLGGAFPLINGMYQKGFESRMADTGKVYFWDTVGAVFGSLLSGFLLIPYLGLTNSLIVPIIVNLSIIIIIIFSKNIYRILGVVLVIIFSVFFLFSAEKSEIIVETEGNNKDSIYAIELGGEEFSKNRFGNVLFSESSKFGAITVGDSALGIEGNRGLFINYRGMCFTYSTESEVIIGATAAEYIEENGKVLNIGLGCGFTASAVEKNPNTKHLTIVEINPVITKVAKEFFSEYNNDVLNSQKVELIIQDGAEFIRKTEEKFDAIVIDIEEASVIQSSPLYTQDYFKLIKKSLSQDGLLLFWSVNAGPEYTKVMYNTLSSVFPWVRFKEVGVGIHFYASVDPKDFVFTEKEENYMSDVLKEPTEEINTLDNRALEKYLKVEDIFVFPEGYYDKFIR